MVESWRNHTTYSRYQRLDKNELFGMPMSDFKVGDEVQWTHTHDGSGSMFSMSLRNGVIQEIKGDKARLRRGTPKKLGRVDHWLSLLSLQPKGSKKSDLRDFMGDFREAHCGK